MSSRARDLLIGLALALIALAGAAWQVEQSAAAAAEKGQDNLPRLICPLH
jgi:hypothetical protein